MDTIGAILRDEPVEIPTVPVALDRLLRRCVEKDPERRFQSAADLSFVLGTLAEAHRIS
jgi:serine/threonine protein kinase